MNIRPISIPAAQGGTVRAETAVPADLKAGEKRTAVVLIGDSVSPESLEPVSEALNDTGLIVVSYDRAESGTGTDFVKNAQALIEQVSQDPSVDKIALLAHGEGTAVATALAATGTPLAGVIMMGLVAQPFEELVDQTTSAEAREESEDRFGPWLNSPSNLEQVAASANELSRVPLFLMVGEEDQTTPLESQSLPMQEKLLNLGLQSTLKTYPELNHEFARPGSQSMEQTVLTDLKDWVGGLKPITVEIPEFKPRPYTPPEMDISADSLREAKVQLGAPETTRRALVMHQRFLIRTPYQALNDEQFEPTFQLLKETPYQPELMTSAAHLATGLYRRAQSLPLELIDTEVSQEPPEVAFDRAERLANLLGEWHQDGKFQVTEGGKQVSTERFLELLRERSPGATSEGLEFLSPNTNGERLKDFYHGHSKERRVYVDALEKEARQDPGLVKNLVQESRAAYLSSGNRSLFRHLGILLNEAQTRPNLEAQFRQLAPELLKLYDDASRFGLVLPDSSVGGYETERIIFPAAQLAGESLKAEHLLPYLQDSKKLVRDRAATELEGVWMKNPETVKPTMDWLVDNLAPSQWIDVRLLGTLPREPLAWDLAQVASERHGWEPTAEQQDWMRAVQQSQTSRDPNPVRLGHIQQALESTEAVTTEQLLDFHQVLEEVRASTGEFRWVGHLTEQLAKRFPLDASELRERLESFPWEELENPTPFVMGEFAFLNAQTQERPTLRREFLGNLGNGKVIIAAGGKDYIQNNALTSEWLEEKVRPAEYADTAAELAQEGAELVRIWSEAHSHQHMTIRSRLHRYWDAKLAELDIDRGLLREFGRNLKEEVVILAGAIPGPAESLEERLQSYNELRRGLPELDLKEADLLFNEAMKQPQGVAQGVQDAIDRVNDFNQKMEELMSQLPNLDETQAEQLFGEAQSHPDGWDKGLEQVVHAEHDRQQKLEFLAQELPWLRPDQSEPLFEEASTHSDGWEAGVRQVLSREKLYRAQAEQLLELAPDLTQEQLDKRLAQARGHQDGWKSGLREVLRDLVIGAPAEKPTDTEILIGEDFMQIGDFDLPIRD